MSAKNAYYYRAIVVQYEQEIQSEFPEQQQTPLSALSLLLEVVLQQVRLWL